MNALIAVIVCVIINSIAQVLLKMGMGKGGFNINTLTNLPVISGAVLYALSFLIWLYVLSKAKLSYAYPFISLSYVLVVFLSYIILGEPFSKEIWIGVILITIGVSIIGFYG